MFFVRNSSSTAISKFDWLWTAMADGTNQNQMKNALFLHCIWSFEGTSYLITISKMQPLDLLFLVVLMLDFTHADIIFH